MKERPDPDYFLEVRDLRAEKQPEVARHLAGGWLLTINHVVTVVLVPYLPTTPWPPPAPTDLDHARDRDEAAQIVLATNTHLVAPTDGPERIEELRGDIPERQTIFWVAADHHAELDRELAALAGRGAARLSELSAGALKTFLVYVLPASEALSRDDRTLLCLP
jgi:hypothetical protein